jgi:hypothetical protein
VQNFPGSQILKSGATSSGFAIEMLFPQEVSTELLPFLEECAMRAVPQLPAPVTMEMVPSNAADLLWDLGQQDLSHSVRKWKDPLIEMIKFGSLALPCPVPHLQPKDATRAFTLLEAQNLEKIGKWNHIRLEGAVYESKGELKEFVKDYKQFKAGSDHWPLGIKMGYWNQEKEWTPKGVLLWEMLRYYYTNQAINAGLMPADSPDGSPVVQLPKRFHTIRVANKNSIDQRGWLAHSPQVEDRIYYQGKFDLAIPTLTSLLQSVANTFTILSIPTSARGSLPSWSNELAERIAIPTLGNLEWDRTREQSKLELEWTLYDSLGSPWQGPFFTLEKEGELWTLKGSVLRSWHRLIALAMEHNKGQFAKVWNNLE